MKLDDAPFAEERSSSLAVEVQDPYGQLLHPDAAVTTRSPAAQHRETAFVCQRRERARS